MAGAYLLKNTPYSLEFIQGHSSFSVSILLYNFLLYAFTTVSTVLLKSFSDVVPF